MIFLPEDYGVPPSDELILLSNTSGLTNPALPKFLDALQEGANYLVEHPDEMLARFLKDNPSLNDKLDIASWKALPGYFAQDPAHLDAARYTTYRDFMLREKLIKQALPLGDYAVQIKAWPGPAGHHRAKIWPCAMPGRAYSKTSVFRWRPASWWCCWGRAASARAACCASLPGWNPAEGSVRATDGQKLSGRVAYMGQQDLLFPWARVLDNVMLGSRLRGEVPDQARAQDLLARVGLEGRERALPAALSGGQRQRAALARTLYERRPIVLMDEPFSALDSLTRARIQDLAVELLAGCTTLLITHDPLEACRLGHHLFVLSGQPARLGAPIAVPGMPPRALDDAAVLQTQGRLLRLLSEMA